MVREHRASGRNQSLAVHLLQLELSRGRMGKSGAAAEQSRAPQHSTPQLILVQLPPRLPLVFVLERFHTKPLISPSQRPCQVSTLISPTSEPTGEAARLSVSPLLKSASCLVFRPDVSLTSQSH